MKLDIKGASALLSTSKCMCMWAGAIEITHPGQDAVYEGGPMTITITDPTMETLQSLESMGGDVDTQGALGSGLQPASLLPSLQTAIGDVQMPQIPSFVTEMKDSAETLLQKAINAIESGKEKSNDIRSSAKANKDNIAKELKDKAESKCKEIESYKAIVGVKGSEDKAFQWQEITYEAIVCGKDGQVNEECDVRWAIKVGENGDIEELKSKCGKSIVLEIKPEWADKKEITIMPYLNSNSPDKDMSVKTKVEKVKFPIVIMETGRKEGKNEDGTFARDMHFGIKFGDDYTHTDRFNLEQEIENEELLKAIKKDLDCSEATLFGRFKNLIEWTSTGKLQDEICEMASKMKSLKAAAVNADVSNKPEEITKAVFIHEETKKLITGIEEYTVDEIKKIIKHHNGNINKVEKKIERNYNKNPKYSTTDDLIKGLRIAINDTWGYRAEIIDYTYDSYSKESSVTLKIRIFDHFGLDYDDIKKFGTGDLVQEHFPARVNEIRDFLNRSNALLEISAYYFSNTAAEGFRAWFILQHYHGYRPLINIMEKEFPKFSING